MFKLESYITPLILSYVDKYVKNLKPEDSQVSLWGGDAVFSNLDLRLDVLEKELCMPFSFVNGHIHELRIHVPWTKLGSEPVVITINTIECILKLYEGCESSVDSSGIVRTGSSCKVRGEPKIIGKRSDAGTAVGMPPNYVQSLVNRVINNIAIICNNVILKYVEDDIVLSLNVKSAEAFSANEKWQQAFVDLSLPELVLRKLIKLQDLTVCLDRRNASGKITTYQDPLLYRCSLDCRLYMTFESLHARHLFATKLDILCDQLDFSITEYQLPMFLRLIELCLALHANEISTPEPTKLGDGGSQSSQELGESRMCELEEASHEVGWGAWMWSYVPTGFAGWSENEEPSSSTHLPSSVFHLGFYIQRASFVFKIAEPFDGTFSVQKITFLPMCSLLTEGVFIDIIMRGIDVFNCQMGITKVWAKISGSCCCGADDSYDSQEENKFFTAGMDQLSNTRNYFVGSLFDEEAVENQGQHREYCFEWDEHFTQLSNVVMQTRTPAFAMDYFYLLEIPEDLSDKSSGFSINDLENVSLKERAVSRIIIGPSKLDLTSSIGHRLKYILKSTKPYDYMPYNKSKEEMLEETSSLSGLDEMSSLEKFVPSRQLNILVVKPIIKLFIQNHPTFDSMISTMKSAHHRHSKLFASPVDKLPTVVIHGEIVDIRHQCAMYPCRVVKAASLLKPPSDLLLYNSHAHFNVELIHCESYLMSNSNGVDVKTVLISPCNLSIYRKCLLLPKYWKNQMQPKTEVFCKMNEIELFITMPQILLLKMFWNSWFNVAWKAQQIFDTSVIHDNCNTTNMKNSTLEITVTDTEWRKSETSAVYSYSGVLGNLQMYLHYSDVKHKFIKIPILYGPEEKSSDAYLKDFFNEKLPTDENNSITNNNCISFMVQLPKDASLITVPVMFVFSSKTISVCLDPRLFEWLAYQPCIHFVSRAKIVSESKQVKENQNDKETVLQGSGLSSVTTIPTESKTKSQTITATVPEKGAINDRFLRGITDLIIDKYSLLQSLFVHIDIEGCCLILPKLAIPWSVNNQKDITLEVKNVYLQQTLPDTIIIHSPRLCVASGSQKHLNLLSFQNIPVVSVEGWCLGSECFPWTIQIDHYSILTLLQSRHVQYCLSPGSLSATVALSSKSSPVTSSNITQLSICIHCDFQQIHFHISNMQARLTAELIQNYLRVLPSILILIGSDKSHMMQRNILCSELPQLDAKVRKISGTSSHLESGPAAVLEQDDIDNKYVVTEFPKPCNWERVKVSIWLQTTLPKLTLDLIGCRSDSEICLKVELEDVSSSVDIQDVYSKVKLKVASLNATNYSRKTPGSEWELGPYEGISICCGNRLTKTVYSPNPKTGMKCLYPHSSLYDEDDSQPSNGSFLLITFTRAQCKNVQKRWAKILRDCSNSELGGKLHDLCEKSSGNSKIRHVSEIDVKVLSFDCILWTPLLLCIIQTFQPITSVLLPCFSLSTISPNSGCNLSSQTGFEYAASEVDGTLPLLSTLNLPLVYFSSNTIRVFSPSSMESAKFPTSTENHFENLSKGQNARTSIRKEDLIILQIGSINMTPNVDNPLSRLLLKPDIYNIAQRAGILMVPGSEVEDRQYQLDITNLSLNTGSWNEILHYTKSSVMSSEVAKLKTMGENPALAWNTKLEPSDSIAEVIFMPIVSQFNLRIVAAPAIVYQKGGLLNEGSKDILVAGHSLEINATTNIEFFIGLHQLVLLEEQITLNLKLLNSLNELQLCLKNVSSLHESHNVMSLGNTVKEIRDSGIDSEASTLGHLLLGLTSSMRISAAQNVVSTLPLPSCTLPDVATVAIVHEDSYTPFEILLTASRITVAFYSPKHLLGITDSPKLLNATMYSLAKKTPSMEGANTSKSSTRKRSSWARQEEASTSTEESPARIIKVQAKHSCQEMEFISEMAGYEGSEESLDEGSSEENSDLLNSMIYEIVPLVYLVVSQPYTFLKCNKVFQKLELSCFDINIKGTSSEIPIKCVFPTVKPDVYDVFWFETLPGDVDPKTGIPPALYTLTVKDFLRKPSIQLKLERPLKVNINAQMQHEVMNCFETLSNILFRSDPTSSDADILLSKNSELQKDSTHFNLEAIFDKFRCYLRKNYKIAYQTQQLVFVLETNSLPDNNQMLININKSSADLNFKCNQNNLLHEVLAEFSFGGCLLQTVIKETARTMIGPLSVMACFSAVWEEWNFCMLIPNITMKIDFDMLLINIDQEHLKCSTAVVNHFFNCAEDSVCSDQTFWSYIPPFILQPSNAVSQYQIWQDDLRIGVFQYTQDSDDIGVMPHANEIVFCKENGGHPASMTWRYPQPRVLTRTEVHPVPFRAASDAVIDSDSKATPSEVQCALQYWDSLHCCFITYRVFQLSETHHCILDLPLVVPENYKDLVASHTWRVVMDYSDPDDTYESINHHHGFVSPLALAACMRVDSCFDSLFLPFLDCLISFDAVKITLSNHLPQIVLGVKGGIPILKPYQLDGTMPVIQEFLLLCLENVSFRGRRWYQACKLEGEVIVRMEFLDYKFLTLQSLIEPVTMNCQVSVIQDNDKPTVAEGSISIGALFLHIGQSAIHTLSSGIKAWKEDEETRGQFLMNSYIICNDTQDLLRFGQVDTDENIALQKYQAHAYSWRTFKAKQVLHVCVEGMKWKWCEPFKIDEAGVQVRIIENKLQKATLIIKVNHLNSMQKQVIIGGQLVVVNRLMHHLEVRLKCSRPQSLSNVETLGDFLSDLPAISCAPTFIVQHEHSWSVQVRPAGSSDHFSEIISLNNGTTPSDCLITIPVKDSVFPINFWCHVFTYHLGNAMKKVVMLSPLYVVRSHLPVSICLEIATPALSQKHTINIEGKGHEHHICCLGDPSLTHHLSFCLAPELELSSPSLPLSPAMISQAVKMPLFKNDWDSWHNDWDSLLSYLWPYNCEELEKEIEILPPCILSSLKSEIRQLSQTLHCYQPNIDLGVCLIQRWPGCQTLLIDVKPWGLLMNQSGIDIIMQHKDDVLIPENAVFALPKLEGNFKLGIAYMGAVYYSNNVEQSAEDWSLNRYWPTVHGVLSRNGHVLCRIIIDTPTKLKACYLTVCTQEKEGIRIFTIRPYYTFVNTTQCNLRVTGVAISRTGPKIKLNPENLSAVKVEGNRVPTPFLFWDVVTPLEGDETELHDDEDDYFHYLKFYNSLNEQRHSAWSLPVPLKKLSNSDPGCIYSVVIPTTNESVSANKGSKTFHLTCHHYKGSNFLIINNGKPHFKLHNNCSFPLYFGQGISKLEVTDYVVYEEAHLIDELPLLLPHDSSYYTYPIIMEKFPEIYEPKTLPKLHLAAIDSGGSGPGVIWSNGIDILATSDQFLSIPNCGDVKIHIEKTMAITHIFLDPVNRVEVSASEIRSRIKIKESPERAPLWHRTKSISHKQKPSVHGDKVALLNVKQSEISETEGLLFREATSGQNGKRIQMAGNDVDPFFKMDFHDKINAESLTNTMPLMSPSLQLKSKKNSTSARLKDRFLCYFTINVKHVCIILRDESKEVIRMIGDDLYLMTRPLQESSSSRQHSAILSHLQELLLCVGNMQIDNQLHSLGGHDFPVILIGYNHRLATYSMEHSVTSDMSRIRRESLLMAVVVLQQPIHDCNWYAEDVELTIKPLAVYFEDSLLYSLLQLLQKCHLSSLCSWSQDTLLKDRTVPQQVWMAFENMCSPISLQRFSVHPISLMLSLHASLKLFISLDHTPLSFREFEKCQFLTTWYRFGHVLTMHYLSGALIRAGWVLGSLDLLANPGGFARSVSAGMTDFFRLPYHGLMHGPWAFVLGISQGSSSLFRHITSGTLVSVTNLASSIARNMDRLSLDRSHLERNEELRRCPPTGFTSGLTQGLTGLGISLLGAIAGIVDQPLQSIQGGTDQVLSPTAAAAGVISGVGKGLVGIVTKPIGGAAEFVAQAGQGILHGTGWTKILKCRYAPIPKESSSTTNSHLKYLWKMLSESHWTSSIFALDATHINSSGSYVAVVLLLTPEALFVVSVESDMQQQAFSLTEVDCRGHTSDPTLVYFVSREDVLSNSTQPEDKNRDRITEFISKSTKYMLGSQKTDELENLSDSSSQPSQTVGTQQTSIATSFYINPCIRSTFLVLYQMVQRKLLGKGYPM